MTDILIPLLILAAIGAVCALLLILAAKYFATEEMSEREVDFLAFCYNDVTSDTNDFTNGLAGVVYPGGVRN